MRREILAGRARLEGVSRALAERYARQAPAAWERLGPRGFARWLALGETLASGEPPLPEAAGAFFDADTAGLALETAEAWCAAARALGRASRRLAATFVERTAGLLAREDAVPRLGALAGAALWLHQTHGWSGPFLAEAFIEADPGALAALPPGHYRPWAEAGRALANASRERDVFCALPPGLAGWGDDERARFFRAVAALGAASPRHALAVYRGLPPSVAALAPGVREALGRVLAALDPRVASLVAEVVPVAGAIAGAVPARDACAMLGLLEDLARRHPEAALAALRQLPRLHEEADAAQVGRWFAAGAAIAAENPAAGRAYFALESRTSLSVLRAASTAATLEETEGVWRKLVQMLSEEAVVVRPTAGLSLRPPVEEHPEAAEVALPERIDLFATHEENCRLYRVLAASVAGRREFGTYAIGGLVDALRDPDAPELLEDCFLLAEGVRVQHRVGAAYPGLGADARWAASGFLARVAGETEPGRGAVFDALLSIALADVPPATWPAWLPRAPAAAVLRLLAPLSAPGAGVEDALRVARALVEVLAPPAARRTRWQAEAELLVGGDLGVLDPASYGDDGPVADGRASAVPAVRPGDESAESLRVELAPPGEEPPGGGRPLSLEELRRLLAAGATVTQAAGEGDEGPGLPITDLVGKLPAAELEALRRLLEHAEASRRRPRRAAPGDGPDGPAFFYDEWDHVIGDYRSRWCRLVEVEVAGDSGEYFGRTLAEYAALIPEVRRQFQRLRPERYRPVRGLEDGEDFDLGAVVDARAEARARRAPTTKLYRSRVREARDVATLFLLDMSASTDEPVPDVPGRRIIDVTREALVVMTEALDTLGDAYAIYGFSGQGRGNVEFYPVKGFNETLGPGVKARLGGLEPKRSTRMGAALRHAVVKMAGVGARLRHLILLSDGFPQDIDYGEDRRSHAYGIRDTAVALREAEAAGITPFCITVDRAGHDYLRQMCDPRRYLVIEDVAALPRELPKIYARLSQPLVRA